jgi:protein O-GlcNAc transferase
MIDHTRDWLEVQPTAGAHASADTTGPLIIDEPLKGPVIPAKQQMMIKAYRHVFADEWWEAIECFEALLYMDTPPAEFLSSYGTCLMKVGRAAEAAKMYERALVLRPEKMAHREGIIFTRDHCDDTTAEHAYALRREFWNLHMKEIAEKSAAPHLNDRDPERPLRIGYLSADFRSHSANMAFGRVVVRHTPAVEVFCYSSMHPSLWDEYTTLYTQEVTFRVIDGIDDETAAMIIRRDKIDILVDLAAYSHGGRLGIFARKPAPIQVTAWGYVLGTGMDTVDVIFGDPVAMPLSHQPFYRERIVHLPSIVPFAGQMYAPDVSILPCLPEKPFTFGCFNRAAKIGETTLRMWSKIMHAVPTSRLLLKEGQIGHPYHRERILKALDVSPERVAFGGQTPHKPHLETYNQIDLALDPYPIAGGISALEGLWQGVPMLVRIPEGNARVVSLVGLSALRILGLDDFAAPDEESYVRLAVRWATEGRESLAQWRMVLREKMFQSPLIQGYVEATEAVYRDLWKEWVKNSAVS